MTLISPVMGISKTFQTLYNWTHEELLYQRSLRRKTQKLIQITNLSQQASIITSAVLPKRFIRNNGIKIRTKKLENLRRNIRRDICNKKFMKFFHFIFDDVDVTFRQT